MGDGCYHSIFFSYMPDPARLLPFRTSAGVWGVFKLSREREEMACLSNVESVASSVTPPCVDFISKWDDFISKWYGPLQTNRAIFDTSATKASSQTNQVNQETPSPAAPLVHSSPIKKSNSSVTPLCLDFISKFDGPSQTNRAIFYTSATEAFSQTNQETLFAAAPLVHSSPIKKSNSKMLRLKEEINDPNFLCLGLKSSANSSTTPQSPENSTKNLLGPSQTRQVLHPFATGVSSPVELPGTSETNQVLGRGFVGESSGMGFHRDEEINDTNYLNTGLISGATSSTKTLRISKKTNEGKDHPGKKNKKQRLNNKVLEKGKAPMLNDDY